MGGVTLSVDTANPLSTAITSSLKVSVPSGTTGQVGFSNSGYLGVPVNADTYANYFWMKGTYTGDITLELVGNSSGTVYASQTISVQSVSSSFTYYETTYTSTQAPDGNNIWQLTFNGASVAGGALYFDLVQLFPVTYHARYTILRLSPKIFTDQPDTMASAMTWEPFLSNFKRHFSAFLEATTCRLCRC